jgi:hypothetical protein
MLGRELRPLDQESPRFYLKLVDLQTACSYWLRSRASATAIRSPVLSTPKVVSSATTIFTLARICSAAAVMGSDSWFTGVVSFKLTERFRRDPFL